MKSLRLAGIGCAVASMFGTSIASQIHRHTHTHTNIHRVCGSSRAAYMSTCPTWQLLRSNCALVFENYQKNWGGIGQGGARRYAEVAGNLNKLPMCAAVERFDTGTGRGSR